MILVPRRPPSKLRVDTMNGSAVRLNWEALSIDDQSGPISNYKVCRFIFLEMNKIFLQMIFYLDLLLCSANTSINLDNRLCR